MSQIEKSTVDCDVPDGLISEEPQIDLEKYFRNNDEANEEIEYFEKNFKTSLGPDYPGSVSNEVQMNHLMELRKKAKAAAVGVGLGEGQYVTALRLILGMQPGTNNVQLLYQPVYCKVYKKARKIKTNVKHVNKNTYYIYTPSGFKSIKKPDRRAIIGEYRSKILIRKKRGQNFKNFKERKSWKGDTQSAIFAFQEIYCLYFNTYSGDTEYKDIITVSNCAVWKNRGIPVVEARRFKHSFLLSTGGATEVKIQEVFYSPYTSDSANLAHLCPPSKNCKKVNFPAL